MSTTRRALLTGSFALLAAPRAPEAQQAVRMYRIGLVGLDSSETPGHIALRQGLRDLGYEEGKNLVIEFRAADGRYDRLPSLMAELVQLKVDVLVTNGTPGARAAKQATTTIPVVVAIIGDAVAAGIVPSLARPGGNITGSQFHFPDSMAKRIELLREMMRRLTRVAVIFNEANQAIGPALRAMEHTARTLNIALNPFGVRGSQDFGSTVKAIEQRGSEALIIADDSMLRTYGRLLAELAAKHRLPSIGDREYAMDGGLLAYAVNRPQVWRRAALFVDRILKGAKPADLPFEQTDRIELVINLKTAKALGLTIPSSLLLRADQVIE